MGRRNPLTDWAQFFLGERYSWHNQARQIWWRSLKGFRGSWGSNFSISHWLCWSSLQVTTLSHYRVNVWYPQQDGRWKITLMFDGRRFCIPKFRSSTLQQTTRQWRHRWFPTTSCFGVTNHSEAASLHNCRKRVVVFYYLLRALKLLFIKLIPIINNYN